MRKLAVYGALAALSAFSLRADFRFEETSKITGGTVASMMKIAGAFSKKLREPVRTTVLVRENQMARVQADRVEVIDLNKETITQIDLEKRTYSVLTFEQVRTAMADAARKVEQGKDPQTPDADLNLKLDIKATGQQRDIAGLPAKELILNISMAADKDSGQKGRFVVTSDLWISPVVTGYEEVHEFNRRMAEKIAFNPASAFSAAAAQSTDLMKGMAALHKQASLMDGMPVLQISRMGANADGSPLPAPSPDHTPSLSSAAGTAAANTATDAVATAAASSTMSKLGRLGGAAGGLGGLGGFGRRKKDDHSGGPAKSEAADTAGDAILMELRTEFTGFTTTGVDAAQFAVPVSFRKVEPEAIHKRR